LRIRWRAKKALRPAGALYLTPYEMGLELLFTFLKYEKRVLIMVEALLPLALFLSLVFILL
jgi:hypothetical protein